MHILVQKAFLILNQFNLRTHPKSYPTKKPLTYCYAKGFQSCAISLLHQLISFLMSYYFCNKPILPLFFDFYKSLTRHSNTGLRVIRIQNFVCLEYWSSLHSNTELRMARILVFVSFEYRTSCHSVLQSLNSSLLLMGN